MNKSFIELQNSRLHEVSCLLVQHRALSSFDLISVQLRSSRQTLVSSFERNSRRPFVDATPTSVSLDFFDLVLFEMLFSMACSPYCSFSEPKTDDFD